jgi:hypothetical protein
LSNAKLIQLQLALFFAENEPRPDKLGQKITDTSLGDVFNQMPIIMPIPLDAPPEIPVVILRSMSDVYSCNISRSRIDFFVKPGENDDSNQHLIDFIEHIRPFASVVFANRKVNRFGFIGQYMIRTNDPVSKIHGKYLKYNFGDLEELSIRFNKRFKSKNGNLLMNRLIDISKANFTEKNGKEQVGIFIQKDINNVPNDRYLNIEDVLAIIKSEQDDFNSESIMELV